ncbi:MAG: zf-HC2 domain-containing protein, partial [Planctomycetes bacterium]|nr:zf-HC2 domain-containing protein [Planctomycetota bacterium]
MKCEEVQQKLYDLVFDLLDGDEREQVEKHLQSCRECRQARDKIRRQKEALREWDAPPPPEDLAERTIKAAQTQKKGMEGQTMASEPVEPKADWLGSKRFWKIAAAAIALITIGLLGIDRHIATRHAKPQETMVYGRWAATPGQIASFRLFVRDGKNSKPVPDAKVSAALVNPGGKQIWEGTTKTDKHGNARVEPELAEDLSEGDYTLRVRAKSAAGKNVVSRTISVERSFRVMISSDKPLYQPGQTIHIP